MNATLTPTTLPLADIDLPPEATRRRRGDDKLAILRASMATFGRLLQPVLVTREGNRHRVVDGTARVLAARELGWAEIPVHVIEDLADRDAAAAQVAANTVRTPLTVPEQWRAVAGLVDQGWPADQAAMAIGLTERQARQLDRLGRLHPDLLALAERSDWEGRDDDGIAPPDEDELGAICRLSQDEQASVLQAALANGEHHIWYRMAHAAARAGKRYSRLYALFDAEAAGIAFQQDFFAEPGSADEWTTTEADAYLEAQEEAIRRKIARKPQLHLVKWDADNYRPTLPAGFREDARGQDNVPSLSKTDHRSGFVAVDPHDGRAKWRLGTLPRSAELPPAPPPSATAADEAENETDNEKEAQDEQPITPPAAKKPLTAHGDELLARARTEAIRAALRQPDLTISPDDLVALMVIGLTSHTVTVRSSSDKYSYHVKFDDLVAQLITPEGHLSPTANPYRLLAEALARMLTVPPINTDKAAEWIGGAINATDHLPRLDTEAFLATVSGEVLRARALVLGLKLTKVGAIRDALKDSDPDWRPTFAQFGAPGPRPEAAPLPRRKEPSDD